MNTPDDFRADVQSSIASFLKSKRAQLARIDELGVDLEDVASKLLSGGKRMRPEFCRLAWHSVADYWDPAMSQADTDAANLTLVRVGTALELFQAAALVHDDIIDHSDTRRGMPSAHRAFQAMHSNRNWDQNPAEFGTSAAILLGDILLQWATEEFTTALFSSTSDGAPLAASIFYAMCTEVSAGQYLDLSAEQAWRTMSSPDSKAMATKINLYKSAGYSIKYPCLIGAALAGANTDQMDALATFGMALGEAFQLRDDVLGVFGDESVTGKPAGDDLREGKRTLLVILTRDLVASNVLHVIDDLLGDPTLDAQQIELLRQTIQASGALDKIEARIEELRNQALAALGENLFSRTTLSQLHQMAIAATDRRA